MPALDANSASTTGVSNAFSVTGVNTATTNEILCVLFVGQSGSGAGSDSQQVQVSSISDNNGLSWQKRFAAYNTDSDLEVELWFAPAPLVQAGNTVNVFLSRQARSAVLVFAIQGVAALNAPFDTNATNPTPQLYTTTTGSTPPISSNQARNLVLAACGVIGNASAPAVSSPLTMGPVANGTYATAFLAYQARTAQANNIQAIVTAGGVDDLTIIGDCFAGPGWLRYDFFVGGG